MFLLLGGGFGIAAFVLFIEVIVWIMKKIKRKFFHEKEHDQNSDLDNPGDTKHEDKINELQEKLVHDDRNKPGCRNRRVCSADERFRTCDDFDEKSHNRLQYLIPVQSMTSLPVTSTPKLKRSRIQTPRPSYTFTAGKDSEMSEEEIQEARSYTEYINCEEASSMRPNFQTEHAAGAEVQEHSYHMSENDASGLTGIRLESGQVQ
jgi:hypothetical protein